MTRSRRLMLAGSAFAVFVALGSVDTFARAGTGVRVTAPTRVSGQDPLPTAADSNHCGSARGTDFDRHGWEAETALAVDPTEPDRVVTAWIQDWSDAIGTAHSSDGGDSWSRVVPPSTICTPRGDAQFENGATDPWLAFDAAGTAYLSGFETGQSNTVGAVFVDTSTDGGTRWSTPSLLDEQTFPSYVDGSQVVTDPTQPGHVFAAWRVGNVALSTRMQYLSMTTDSGRSWAAPVLIPGPSMVLGGRLVVLADHSLVDVYAAMLPQPGAGIAFCPTGPTGLFAIRSTDAGQTWSAPSLLGLTDARSLSVPATAVTPGGDVAVAWQQIDPVTGHTRVELAAYSPDTVSWSTPSLVADEPGQPEYGGDAGPQVTGPSPLPSNCPVILASPALAVAGNGTIGVMFYDHRDDPTGNPARTTDLWLRTSRTPDGPWTETLIAGPFDQSRAPSTSGSSSGGLGFLGDYQTLTAVAHGFVAGYVLSRPLDGANFGLDAADPTAMRTDVYFSRIRLPS